MAEEFAKRLYATKAWKDLRRNIIIQRQSTCDICHRLIIDTSQLVGHHKIKLTKDNVNDVNIALNPKNIDLVCFDCHNKEHKRFGYASKAVYIVYGSPCSGKSTLVRQMAERGDIIVDIDMIYQAISGMALHDKPNNLRFNAFVIKDSLLDMVKRRYGKWNNAYIIGGYPNQAERERIAQDLGATLVYSEATKEECYGKAKGDRTLIGYIDKWWAEASPPC